ncbi:MAG: dolichol-phosphate mannosyltransferase, partial [Amphiamblys sp. WSBS2006]
GDKSGVDGWPTGRKVISMVANTLTNSLLGTDSSDVTGSFRVYKRSVFDELVALCQSDRFFFQIEMLFLAKEKGFLVGECPIRFVDRLHGVSKMNIGESLEFLSGLARLFCAEV